MQKLSFSFGNIDVKVITDDATNLSALHDFLDSDILISPDVHVSTYDAAKILSDVLFQTPFDMLDRIHFDYIKNQLARRQLSGWVKEKLLQHILNN